MPNAALAAVRLAVRSPLVVAVEKDRVPVSPQRLGLKAYVEAIERDLTKLIRVVDPATYEGVSELIADG